jgi:hypothetical protein
MLTYKELDRYGDPMVLDAGLRRVVSGYPDDVSCEAVADAVGTAYSAINVEPEQAVVDKACALLLCHTSEAPWSDIVIFEKVADALSGFEPDHSKLEGSTAEQVSLAVCLMKKINKKTPFNNQVVHYIRGIMRDDGIVCYPECLDFAQEEYTTEDLKNLCKQVSDKRSSRANVEGVTYDLESADPLDVQLAKLSLVQEYVNAVINPKKAEK